MSRLKSNPNHCTAPLVKDSYSICGTNHASRERHTETERDRERETERDRERQRERHTERDTERDRQRDAVTNETISDSFTIEEIMCSSTM